MLFAGAVLTIHLGGCVLILNSEYFSRRHYLYIGVGVLAAIAAGAIFFTFGIKPLPAFIGAMFVTLGWIVTNEISVRNAKRQHGFNFMTTYENSAQRVKDHECICRHLEYGEVLKNGFDNYDFENLNSPLLQAVERELNAMEFLAIGVLGRHFEEKIVKEYYFGIIQKTCREYRLYIDFWREKQHKDLWIKLDELNVRWNGK